MSSSEDKVLSLLDLANSRELPVRLLGGWAFWFRCKATILGNAALQRGYPDIDLAGRHEDSQRLEDVLLGMGYRPERAFNFHHGAQRLRYRGDDGSVEVFLDEFRMCHRWSIRERLHQHALTLPLSDLLLTKLQIVDFSYRDGQDVFALLLSHQLSDGVCAPDTIDLRYVASLARKDWGLSRTVLASVGLLHKAAMTWEHLVEHRDRLDSQLTTLGATVRETPKALLWKLRSVIGPLVRWYDRPE